MTDIVERLRDSKAGAPATITWPHRVLQDAVDEIEWLRSKPDYPHEEIAAMMKVIDAARVWRWHGFDQGGSPGDVKAHDALCDAVDAYDSKAGE